MTNFYPILLIVLPVFLVIGLGFALKHLGKIEGSFLSQLNWIVFYVALPALLFYKIATADFQASFNGLLLTVLAAAITITWAFSYLLATILNFPAFRRGAFCQGSFRGNFTYIGLAISYNAYGESGLATTGILLGFLVPLLNFLSVLALLFSQRKSEKSIGRAFWLSQLAFNPLILAAFAGILWSYLALPLPGIIDRALSIITGMSLPLALLAIGASFSFSKFRGDLLAVGFATAIKLVFMPVIAASALITCGVSGQDLGIGVILASTPTAVAAYIMAEQMQSDAELSASIIMTTTLFSLLSYTTALYLLSALGL